MSALLSNNYSALPYDDDGLWHRFLSKTGEKIGTVLGSSVASASGHQELAIEAGVTGGLAGYITGAGTGWVIDNRDALQNNLNNLLEDLNNSILSQAAGWTNWMLPNSGDAGL